MSENFMARLLLSVLYGVDFAHYRPNTPRDMIRLERDIAGIRVLGASDSDYVPLLRLRERLLAWVNPKWTAKQGAFAREARAHQTALIQTLGADLRARLEEGMRC